MQVWGLCGVAELEHVLHTGGGEEWEFRCSRQMVSSKRQEKEMSVKESLVVLVRGQDSGRRERKRILPKPHTS